MMMMMMMVMVMIMIMIIYSSFVKVYCINSHEANYKSNNNNVKIITI